MPTLDGTKVRADLLKAAKRRQSFLDAAKKIEDTVFKPLDLDPNTLLKRKKPVNGNGYTDMGGSRLADMVLEFADKNAGNRVTVADVQKLFALHHVRCSPYVLLTRMVRANLLTRTGRGEYVKA